MGAIQGWDRFLTFLIGGVIVFPIGGYWWGNWMWKTMEHRYVQEVGATNARPNP
jgi:hypothetical protein